MADAQTTANDGKELEKEMQKQMGILGRIFKWLGKKDKMKDIKNGVKKFLEFFWGKEATERIIGRFLGKRAKNERSEPNVEHELQPSTTFFQLDKEGMDDKDFMPKEGDDQFKFVINEQGKVELKSLNGEELTKEQSDLLLQDEEMSKVVSQIEKEYARGEEVTHLKLKEDGVMEYRKAEREVGAPVQEQGEKSLLDLMGESVREHAGISQAPPEVSQSQPEVEVGAPSVEDVSIGERVTGMFDDSRDYVDNQGPQVSYSVGAQNQPGFSQPSVGGSMGQAPAPVFESSCSHNMEFGKLTAGKQNEMLTGMMNEKNGITQGVQQISANAPKLTGPGGMA